MIFVLIALLFSQSVSTPTVHFFYRPSCGHCMDILLDDIPSLHTKYRFTLKKHDIDLLDNYRLLEEMEHTYGRTGDDLPVIFVGDSVFYGPEKVYDKMSKVLKIHAGGRQKEPDVPRQDTMAAAIKKVTLYYFFQPGCDECNRLDALFNSLEKRDTIAVLRHSIFEDTSKILLEALSEKIGMPEEKRSLVPVVILGNGYLVKEDITTDNVYQLMEQHRNDTRIIEMIDVKRGEKSILERFGRFSLLGIMIAGFIDGVNPCAFATIIFFVSYLLFLGHRRRDIILMAISFIAAVFIAYFMIGVGAYNLLNYLTRYYIIGKIIFLCFGIIAIILGVLSLRDFFYASKGQYDRIVLQLPLGIKQRIHRDIKERTAVGGIIFGSFIAGLIVSFLEFGCTGQIYLPTITFMISKVGWSLKPLFTLLIYNLMFVLPLILISVLAVVVSTSKISKALGTRIPTIKLLTSILFFVLGILLILSA